MGGVLSKRETAGDEFRRNSKSTEFLQSLSEEEWRLTCQFWSGVLIFYLKRNGFSEEFGENLITNVMSSMLKKSRKQIDQLYFPSNVTVEVLKGGETEEEKAERLAKEHLALVKSAVILKKDQDFIDFQRTVYFVLLVIFLLSTLYFAFLSAFKAKDEAIAHCSRLLPEDFGSKRLYSEEHKTMITTDPLVRFGKVPKYLSEAALRTVRTLFDKKLTDDKGEIVISKSFMSALEDLFKNDPICKMVERFNTESVAVSDSFLAATGFATIAKHASFLPRHFWEIMRPQLRSFDLTKSNLSSMKDIFSYCTSGLEFGHIADLGFLGISQYILQRVSLEIARLRFKDPKTELLLHNVAVAEEKVRSASPAAHRAAREATELALYKRRAEDENGGLVHLRDTQFYINANSRGTWAKRLVMYNRAMLKADTTLAIQAKLPGTFANTDDMNEALRIEFDSGTGSLLRQRLQKGKYTEPRNRV
jgi:hypothetical protein